MNIKTSQDLLVLPSVEYRQDLKNFLRRFFHLHPTKLEKRSLGHIAICNPSLFMYSGYQGIKVNMSKVKSSFPSLPRTFLPRTFLRCKVYLLEKRFTVGCKISYTRKIAKSDFQTSRSVLKKRSGQVFLIQLRGVRKSDETIFSLSNR